MGGLIGLKAGSRRREMGAVGGVGLMGRREEELKGMAWRIH